MKLLSWTEPAWIKLYQDEEGDGRGSQFSLQVKEETKCQKKKKKEKEEEVDRINGRYRVKERYAEQLDDDLDRDLPTAGQRASFLDLTLLLLHITLAVKRSLDGELVRPFFSFFLFFLPSSWAFFFSLFLVFWDPYPF